MIKGIGLFGVACVLGACSIAEPPFVYTNPIVTVTKDRDQLHRTGMVSVCYHDPDLKQARDLAYATCKQYGLEGMDRLLQHDQCKVSAPEKITVRCYDPKMRFANGVWVNPLDPIDVKKWRQEQVRITGKPASEIYAGPIMAVPELDSQVIRNDVDVPMKIEQ